MYIYFFFKKNRCMNILRTDILLFYENFIFELVFSLLDLYFITCPELPQLVSFLSESLETF